MLAAPMLVLSSFLFGQSSQSEDISKEPTEVFVGLFMVEIEALQLKENHFVADFYIWFRWQGDQVRPIESFEITNGKIESKTDPYIGRRGDFNYAYQRVVATITEFWDVRRFPLDRQTLSIAIEDRDNEGTKLKFIADSVNSGVDPQVRVPGCTLGSPTTVVLPQVYTSNYGDLDLPKGSASAYSQFRFSLPIARQGWGYFVKLLFGLFVATAISFLAFWVDPLRGDPRFGLGVGAIFAAVASQYVVSAWLPESSSLVMVDALHILSFFVIFLSLAESTISLRLCATGNPERIQASRRLDRWSFYCLAVGYVIACTTLVFHF
jgi:hypothetical protein